VKVPIEELNRKGKLFTCRGTTDHKGRYFTGRGTNGLTPQRGSSNLRYFSID